MNVLLNMLVEYVWFALIQLNTTSLLLPPSLSILRGYTDFEKKRMYKSLFAKEKKKGVTELKTSMHWSTLVSF